MTKERAWLINCACGTISTNAPRGKYEELKSSFKNNKKPNKVKCGQRAYALDRNCTIGTISTNILWNSAH